MASLDNGIASVAPGMGGSQRLTRLMGQRRALDLMFSARWLKAGEAREAGLVNYVVPDAELHEAALEYCQTIAGRSRNGIAEMKRLEESGGEPFALPMKEGVCRLPFMGRNYLLENRPARKEGFDAVQRQVFQKHVISGLSEETLQAWTEVFGEPPSFHCDID